MTTGMRGDPQGLIMVYSECGPNIAEEEFNDWYDNEHIPPRLTVPGVLSSSRYRAADSQSPSWLALYDVATLDVPQSAQYRALRVNASDRENNIISKLATLNPRVYSHLISYKHPKTAVASLPAKFVFAVHMQVTLEGEAEFNRWYNEEHMVLLSKIPGWLRGRRYRFVEYLDQPVKQEPDDEKSYVDYLAIHELEKDGFMGLPEFHSAIQTPWRTKVMKTVLSRELRLFERYQVFKRAD